MTTVFSAAFLRQSHLFCRSGLVQASLSRNLSVSPLKSVQTKPTLSNFFSSASKPSSEFQHGGLKSGLAQRTSSMPWLYKATGVAGVGLGLSIFATPKLWCESARPTTPTTHPPPPATSDAPLGIPPPPQSSVNYYELTFGTVCGICAGVFMKKGAKALAFVLGGVFVVLQYLGSLSLIHVDWARASDRFENLFYTTDASGARKPPSVGSLFRWIVDFLTADFQQRASFVAGFALGLRIG